MLKTAARWIFSLILIAFGLVLFFYVDIHEYQAAVNTRTVVSEFDVRENVKENGKKKNQSGSKSDERLKKIMDYNNLVLHPEEKTNETVSFDENPFNEMYPDDVFGYVSIPSLDKKFTLFIGASNENLSKGLCIMNGFSIPIGGTGTNCVIAGHRGWNTGNFLRDVEDIGIGNHIYITNEWGTLSYEAVKIMIVNPDDSSILAGEKEKDMVTILTCHPYLSHGKYRYLIFFERCSHGINKEEETVIKKNEVISRTETKFVSSKDEIRMEGNIRKVFGSLIIILSFSHLYLYTKNKRKERRRHENTL